MGNKVVSRRVESGDWRKNLDLGGSGYLMMV